MDSKGEAEQELEAISFRVSDLKQYFFCPRIVYYHYCLPLIRPITLKMQAGREEGENEQLREERRSLKTYHLRQGERSFDLLLSSPQLGLHGRLDLAIKTDDNPNRMMEAIPVDYKLTPGRIVTHFVLQIVAYGMLLEETWNIPVRRGFLYLIPARKAREITITDELRHQVQVALEAMRHIVAHEAMPPPPRRRGKCRVCEFRRFCNDV
ncbi:MAG: CRISPR-associated protein Cas4 [Anaerolineae bacterium]